MSRTSCLSLAFFMAVSVGYQTHAADNDTLSAVINSFFMQYPQEKVFLHFDNTAYYLHEIIWWKAYLLRTDNDSLGSASRVLYVELIDPTGEVLETKKCLVENGVCNGEFMLNRYTQSGLYQVRAYTRNMLNWGTDCLFSRVLPIFKRPTEAGKYSEKPVIDYAIYSPSTSDPNKVSSDFSQCHVLFYPEGGHLVEGLKSKVAFEVTGIVGQDTKVTGWLKIGGKRERRVTILRENRGVFSYTPSKSKATLEFVFPNGKTRSFALPNAKSSGYTLSTDATRADRVTWETGMTSGLDNFSIQTLLIHHGKARAVTSPLMRSNMPAGCSQLVLIDAAGQVLCSRMLFNYPSSSIGSISVNTTDTTIWPGKPMTLNVVTEPHSSVSLSVCDAETQLAADMHNAATWFLLSSDLKGYIRNPEYYFEANDSAHRQAADLLMLTQGWRKYEEEHMSSVKSWKKTYPVERGLLIDGRLKAYNKRSSVNGANLKITMRSRLGSVLSGDVTTDSTGYYVFTVPDCWGDWNMFMNTTLNDKAKRYYITVDRNFSPTVNVPAWNTLGYDVPIVPDFDFTLDKAHIDSIPMELRTHWLEQLDVEARRVWKSPRDFWERESLGAAHASIRYDMVKAADLVADQGEEPPTLVEWLENKNPLVEGYDNITGESCAENAYQNIYGNGPTYGGKGIMWIVNNWFVCGTSIANFGAKDPADTKRLAVANVYMPFDISSIRSVYISTAKDDWRRFIFAPHLEGRGYTTIFVYTHHLEKMPKGLRRTIFKGYDMPNDYAQMMLSDDIGVSNSDYRRTLYWNPNVELDGTGKGNIGFRNNSTSRHMTISATGFTPSGMPLIFKSCH